MVSFNEVFNKASIYDVLFFNVKSVLDNPSLDELKKNNEPLYNVWVNENGDSNDDYINNAIKFPEYNKIVGITYATIYNDEGNLKRYFKKIVNNDESVVIAMFMDILHQLSREGAESTPNYFPILCGHNIIAKDIPLLIKRFLINRGSFEQNIELPYMLKRVLTLKPWESGVMDIVNVWDFNGYNKKNSINLITEFLGLKKKVDLLNDADLSKYYWDNIDKSIDDTLNHIGLQSATETNLVIQLINLLRLV